METVVPFLERIFSVNAPLMGQANLLARSYAFGNHDHIRFGLTRLGIREGNLALSAMGGAISLDGTSAGQFMVSRPLVAATLAGWIVGLLVIDGLTSADFIFGARFYFRPWVLFFSVIKAGIFGVTITFLACFIGLEGRGGAEGVGRTTTAAVVATTVAIMLLDVLLVPLLKVA